MTETDVQEATKAAVADIAALADWVELELAKYDEAKADWDDVGTLQEVRRRLIKALAGLSGVEASEIERSLEELHA